MDRREYDRYGTRIKCKLGLKHGKVFCGIVCNLSTGGAKIEIHERNFRELVKEGDKIMLLMNDIVSTKAECEIRWISDNKVYTVIGVRFLKTDKNFPRLLSTYAMPHIPDIYFR